MYFRNVDRRILRILNCERVGRVLLDQNLGAGKEASWASGSESEHKLYLIQGVSLPYLG